MKPHTIKDGRDLDWDMARKAAEAILKQCNDAAYCPPEAMDIHIMRVDYVCQAMDAIADALKLRKKNP